jgi:peptide/nickel transport system permease protein
MIIMEQEQSYNKTKKKRFLTMLKFYLIPGWRIPEFSKREYEIELNKSKRRFFRHLLNTLTISGFLIFFIFVFMGVFCPWLTQFTVQDVVPPSMPGIPFADPSLEHPLGTTKNGYDMLARILWGARTSLFMAVIPSLIAIMGGLVLGTISAYFGGRVDSIMMRIVDLIYTIPTLIIVLILVRMIGTGLMTILILYGSFAIPGNTRFMRSLVLQVRQMVYIKAAKTGGASKFKIMFKHIVPNAMPPLIISFFGGMALTVLGIAGLSFLGLGDPTIPNWGQDIYWGDIYHIHAFLWPGLCTAIFAIGAMLLGDGLRDAIDPRLKI